MNAGIQLCARYLATDAMTIHSSCVNHDMEFRDYRNSTSTDKTTRIEYAGERPVKHHADCMDEMRYAMGLLSTWVEYAPQRMAGGLVVRGRR